MGSEIDPALRDDQIGVNVVGNREPRLRAEGEGHQVQSVVGQRLLEIGRLVSIAADHRIGDFDALVTAGGGAANRSSAVPLQPAPSISHVNVWQPTLKSVVIVYSLIPPCVRPSMMCRWKTSTSMMSGTVTTADAAAISPQGT